jgi:hypothetical protein
MNSSGAGSSDLPGLFDFNCAPFFLSFLEVQVERSKKRVVLVLNDIHGPLQWRDLQTGGTVLPPGARPDGHSACSVNRLSHPAAWIASWWG